MIYKDVAKKIEKVRKKLHKSIRKYGLENEKTIRLSEKLDGIINEYLKNNNHS